MVMVPSRKFSTPWNPMGKSIKDEPQIQSTSRDVKDSINKKCNYMHDHTSCKTWKLIKINNTKRWCANRHVLLGALEPAIEHDGLNSHVYIFLPTQMDIEPTDI